MVRGEGQPYLLANEKPRRGGGWEGNSTADAGADAAPRARGAAPTLRLAGAYLEGRAVIRRLLDHGDWSTDADFRLFYNVNFPPVAAADVQGIKVGAQGFRRGTTFTVEPHQSPSGRKFLWVKGGDQRVRTLPDTDVTLNLDGYISVTPMRADLTDHATLAQLRDALE